VLKEPKKMIKDTGRTVRGSNLGKSLDEFVGHLSESYVKITNEHRLSAKPDEEWTTDGLRQFAAKTMFDALFNTIFGRSDNDAFNSQMAFKNFEVFHQYVNFFWLGFPKSWFPPAMKALGELLVPPTAEDFMTRADTSDYIKTAIEYMKLQGQTEGDIKGHSLVYLHVNYNTFRLVFWVLNNLLANPKAMADLQDEIYQATYDRLHEESNTATFTIKDIESLKVLGELLYFWHTDTR